MNKRPITKEEFALMCYIVLMDHHGEGYINATPNYLTEKLFIINEGFNAFARLDFRNQINVAKWLDKWNYELPEGEGLDMSVSN